MTSLWVGRFVNKGESKNWRNFLRELSSTTPRPRSATLKNAAACNIAISQYLNININISILQYCNTKKCSRVQYCNDANRWIQINPNQTRWINIQCKAFWEESAADTKCMIGRCKECSSDEMKYKAITIPSKESETFNTLKIIIIRDIFLHSLSIIIHN